MSSIKATVVPKGDVFEIHLGEHVLGSAKQRFDADLHANVINNALEKAFQLGYHQGAWEK